MLAKPLQGWVYMKQYFHSRWEFVIRIFKTGYTLCFTFHSQQVKGYDVTLKNSSEFTQMQAIPDSDSGSLY